MSEQRIRRVLFYLSLFIFIIGLPFILSFALGYKFNPRTFKFTKTGIIALKTQPQGAAVYLDKIPLNEKTPTTIHELLPGKYNLRIELQDYYSWGANVEVEAGKVTRLEKIILFPVRPNIKQLNRHGLLSFWLDQDKRSVYYISRDDSGVYKSDLEGESLEQIGSLPINLSPQVQWKFSPDRARLLLFDTRWIIILALDNTGPQSTLALEYTRGAISEIFWHSDSYHLVLVTNKNIEALEARPDAIPIVLVDLNKNNTSAFYDVNTDSLFFLDSQEAADGKAYDNIYKLEVGAKFDLLHNLGPAKDKWKKTQD